MTRAAIVHSAATTVLWIVLAVVLLTRCSLYNADMWDGCPPASGLTWDPEGEPQCGYTTASLEAGGTVANGCTMTDFTALDEHGCGWIKQWRCANEAWVTQSVDTVDMWSVVTIKAPTCNARFEGRLTYE